MVSSKQENGLCVFLMTIRFATHLGINVFQIIKIDSMSEKLQADLQNVKKVGIPAPFFVSQNTVQFRLATYEGTNTVCNVFFYPTPTC
jgi:hypothetical protein